jgi:hypothetical protein
MEKKFKAIYDINTGYVCETPKSFIITKDELHDFDDPKVYFLDCMHEHFMENVYPYAKNLDKFLEWFESLDFKNND